MGEHPFEPLQYHKYKNSMQKRASLWYYAIKAPQKDAPNILLFAAELGEGDRRRIQCTSHKNSATWRLTNLS